MKLTAKFVRKQLEHLKPLITGCSIRAARAAQDAIGELISLPLRHEEHFDYIRFRKFFCGMLTPAAKAPGKADGPIDEEAAILYIHGGGYVAGNMEYARGIGSVLATQTGLRVYFPAYRLAPEHRYPAALRDCLHTYRYLTETVGIPADKMILCGESAGGGLIYSICAVLKKRGLPLPAGLVAISPWTDLTQSGESYRTNREVDPSMTPERLEFFASSYTNNPRNPLVSPLFSDLGGLPPSLIFSGGDEVMLDDATALHRRLTEAGSPSRHIIRPGMWHAYPVYGLAETQEDMEALCQFVKEKISHEEKSEVDEA